MTANLRVATLTCPGVQGRVVPSQHSVALTLASPERFEELKELLSRATNTWDKMPEWVQNLYDAVHETPIKPSQRQQAGLEP